MALVIWLTQKEKSAYVVGQALQALVYQVAIFVVTGLAWCCWAVFWMGMIFPPLMIAPDAYQAAPPPGLWIGLIALVVPLGIMGLAVLYGLWGAIRCAGGHEFRYALVGRWAAYQASES